MLLLTPPAHLRPYIDFAWFTPAGPGRSVTSVKLVPDGRQGIVIQHLNGRSAFMDEAGNPLPVAFVYGQSSVPFVNRMTGQPFTMGIYLRSHSIKEIFGIGADKVADGIVDLDELSGYRVSEVLLNLPDAAGVGEHLFELIWKKLSQYGKTDSLITHSMQAIRGFAGRVSPEQIFKTYHLSKRQFQRRFRERAGIPLNTYLRVVRFQAALDWLHCHPGRNLSDAAYDFGYSDQSHFTREFRHFTGYTPKDVAANRIFFPEDAFPGYPLQTRRHIIF